MGIKTKLEKGQVMTLRELREQTNEFAIFINFIRKGQLLYKTPYDLQFVPEESKKSKFAITTVTRETCIPYDEDTGFGPQGILAVDEF